MSFFFLIQKRGGLIRNGGGIPTHREGEGLEGKREGGGLS